MSLVHDIRADTERPPEVIVVDNGLDRRWADAVRAEGARVITMDGNRGFGQAVNRGAAEAEGEILIVINDDISIEPGFIDALRGPIEGGSEMAAGVLLRDERPWLIESAGIEIDAALAGYDYLQNEPISVLEQELAPPLGPSGGAAAYDRSAFVGAGGFDEGFFAYHEDLDLAIRLRSAGARCVLANRARALHPASTTLGYQSLEKATLVARSRGRLIRKYGLLKGPLAARVVATEVVASLILASRHRSLAPLFGRVEGWMNTRFVDRRPPRQLVSVSFREGVSRRYARSKRHRRHSVMRVSENRSYA